MNEIDPDGSHRKTLIDQRSVVDVVKDFANAADKAAIETNKLDLDCKRLCTEQQSMVSNLSDLSQEQNLFTRNLKLCVEQQIATNRKVDRMEKELSQISCNIKELKAMIVQMGSNIPQSSFKVTENHHEKKVNTEDSGKFQLFCEFHIIVIQ